MKNKDAYYFSHDSNARNDPKILKLRVKHGMRGYGIFWALIEMLRDQPDYTLIMDFESLAFSLNDSSEIVESVVCDFGLFKIEKDVFYSQSLNTRMSIKDEKSQKARDAANKRWNKERNAGAMQTHSDGNANPMQLKESKVKEIKLNNNKAFVADANKDLKSYRLYFHKIITERKSSRDVLFKNNNIDLERRNELWEDFILNSITNVPLVEDEKHAWNTFKKFIQDNKMKYQYKKNSLATNPGETFY